MLALVLSVKPDVPGVAGFGEKVHEAPAGSAPQVRLTAELNPPLPAIVTVYDAALPAVTVCDDGDSDNE